MIRCQSVAKQLVRDMRVDFCRAYAGMAKHLLDSEQVGASFKQVGGETMPESVWADNFFNVVLFG